MDLCNVRCVMMCRGLSAVCDLERCINRIAINYRNSKLLRYVPKVLHITPRPDECKSLLEKKVTHD